MGNSLNRSDDRVLPLAPKWHPVNKVGTMVTEASGGSVDAGTLQLIAGVAAAVALIIALKYGPVGTPESPQDKGSQAPVPTAPVRAASAENPAN